MSKTVVTISIDTQTKEEFSKYAKSMWTNMSNLVSMFMKNAPRSKKLEFFSPIEEVEPDKWEKNAINEYENQKKNWTFESIKMTDSFFNQFK